MGFASDAELLQKIENREVAEREKPAQGQQKAQDEEGRFFDETEHFYLPSFFEVVGFLILPLRERLKSRSPSRGARGFLRFGLRHRSTGRLG